MRQPVSRALVLVTCISLTYFATAQESIGPRNWSWPDGDERGAGNLITAASILDALAQVKTGEVIELSHEVAQGAPHIPGLQPPYVFSMYLNAPRFVQMAREHMGATNGIGVNLERIELTTHVGTHIDALGHITIRDEMYNGVSESVGVLDQGLQHAGIEKAPPFIARAVLIDVAAYRGVSLLKPGFAIQPDDLEGALRRQGVTIRKGVIALIHTGSHKTFLENPVQHADTTPGISMAAARWLSSRKVVAVGADNHAIEVLPGEDPKLAFPVHQHLIVNQGIYLIENMKLDVLADRKINESTLIMLPAKFRGATGSPVRVIALL